MHNLGDEEVQQWIQQLEVFPTLPSPWNTLSIQHSIPSAPVWQLAPAPNYKQIPKNFLDLDCMKSFNLLLKDMKEELG